jgi:hypothetical protein
MSDIIETLLLRNLQEVFGEGDPTRRRAAAKDYTPKTVRFFFPSAVMSAARHSIRLPASCAPVIRASSTRPIARHRPFRTQGHSRGAPDRPASRRATQGSMLLSSEMGGSPPYMSSLTRRPHSGDAATNTHRDHSPTGRAHSMGSLEDLNEASA